MKEIHSDREANHFFCAGENTRGIRTIRSEIAFSGSHRARKPRAALNRSRHGSETLDALVQLHAEAIE